MKVLICPDSFKGSLNSAQAAAAIAAGIRSVRPHIQLTKFPLADGGEGTLQAVRTALGGEVIPVPVNGASGRPMMAHLLRLPDRRILLESAQAIGLPQLTPAERNPWQTTSYGLGQLLVHALNLEPREIVIALGGSGTVDGGIGMLQALGARVLDQLGQPVPFGAEGLRRVRLISLGELPERLGEIPLTVLCDVENPLLGEKGAVYTFAMQKGALPKDLPELEQFMQSFATVVESERGAFRQLAGTGAAGGLGFALSACCRGELTPGFSWLAKVCKLESAIRKADWIVTGEGRLDAQSLSGKLPLGVSRLAKVWRKPVIVLAGSVEMELAADAQALAQEGICAAYAIQPPELDLETAQQNAATLLRQKAAEVFSHPPF